MKVVVRKKIAPVQNTDSDYCIALNCNKRCELYSRYTNSKMSQLKYMNLVKPCKD